MDVTTAGIIIAGVTLGFNIFFRLFGGGTKLSSRLASMETSLISMSKDIQELNKLLISMADMRGEVNGIVIRITRVEEDVRDLRKGDGFIRSSRGVNKEYP